MYYIILLSLLWFAFGACLYGRLLWKINYNLTVGDIVVIVLAGILGPINIVFYAEEYTKDCQFLNKIVWPRKR